MKLHHRSSTIRMMVTVLMVLSGLFLSATASSGKEAKSGAGADPARQESAPRPESAAPAIPDFRIPQNITICGERIPLEYQHAYEQMDYEFLLAVHSEVQVILWMRRASRYLPYIEKRLAEEKMPDDLKYLAIAESDLRPTVRSSASASGCWQFMEYTGKRYGLRKDNDFDERLHFEKSTESAIKYLKKLKNMFGKWTLAMAAYNCGEGCVAKAIQEQEVRDYFLLNLPLETERYVYRIAAIKLILQNPAKYGYAMSPELAYGPVDADKVVVNLNREIHLTQAAKGAGTYFKILKELNPEIRGSYLPAGSYEILVPKGSGGKMSAFLQKVRQGDVKVSAPARPAASSYHVVKRGETLSGIAEKTGIPIVVLRKLNGLRGNHLLVGQKLRLNQ